MSCSQYMKANFYAAISSKPKTSPFVQKHNYYLPAPIETRVLKIGNSPISSCSGTEGASRWLVLELDYSDLMLSLIQKIIRHTNVKKREVFWEKHSERYALIPISLSFFLNNNGKMIIYKHVISAKILHIAMKMNTKFSPPLPEALSLFTH